MEEEEKGGSQVWAPQSSGPWGLTSPGDAVSRPQVSLKHFLKVVLEPRENGKKLRIHLKPPEFHGYLHHWVLTSIYSKKF